MKNKKVMYVFYLVILSKWLTLPLFTLYFLTIVRLYLIDNINFTAIIYI